MDIIGVPVPVSGHDDAKARISQRRRDASALKDDFILIVKCLSFFFFFLWNSLDCRVVYRVREIISRILESSLNVPSDIRFRINFPTYGEFKLKQTV